MRVEVKNVERKNGGTKKKKISVREFVVAGRGNRQDNNVRVSCEGPSCLAWFGTTNGYDTFRTPTLLRHLGFQ
jgi:hypothetical protein